MTALVAGFAVLALAAIGAVWQAGEAQRSAGWVDRSLQVENRLTAVLSLLQDAETGERGYLLTGRPEFLQPYRRAVERLPAALEALDRATADDPAQQALLQRLDAVVRSREASLEASLRTAPAPLGPEATAGLVRGKQMMDQARSVIAQMTRDEQVLLARRERAAALQVAIARWGLAAGAVAVALLGLFAFHEGRRRLAALSRAHDELAAVNERLRQDIAERERVEAQLRQLQKMEAIGQLTGGIAHDFNNKLAVIMGSLDLAKRRLTGGEDPRVGDGIDKAIDGVTSAAQLTSRLLAFARRQPLAPEPLDANRLVLGLAELLRRTVMEEVRIETVLGEALWPVSADSNQLENALLNLCINGRDAMPEGGRLTLATANARLDGALAVDEPEVAPGDYVMIAVADTGEGMPAEIAERAFEPFFTTKAVGKGTGLGLSQVYGFVRQSGGHVELASEPGLGTTVSIYLPRLQTAAAALERAVEA